MTDNVFDLFETPYEPERTGGWQTGQLLRDAALAQAKQGREERIARVRGFLIATHRDMGGTELTGDDVLAALDGTEMAEGDLRWTANVLRGWDMVRPTGRYEPSTRPECHARPKLVWRWA